MQFKCYMNRVNSCDNIVHANRFPIDLNAPWWFRDHNLRLVKWSQFVSHTKRMNEISLIKSFNRFAVDISAEESMGTISAYRKLLLFSNGCCGHGYRYVLNTRIEFDVVVSECWEQCLCTLNIVIVYIGSAQWKDARAKQQQQQQLTISRVNIDRFIIAREKNSASRSRITELHCLCLVRCSLNSLVSSENVFQFVRVLCDELKDLQFQ